MFKQISGALSRRRTLQTLASLASHILRDIGIEPGSVRQSGTPIGLVYRDLFTR